jgi:hypothetical protein
MVSVMRIVICMGGTLPFVAACGGTTLINQRIETKGNGFTLAVVEVTDGPDTYEQGLQRRVPDDGVRFLWFKIRVRNDRTTAQVFNYQRCDIDFGEHAVMPNFVDMDKIVNILVESGEEKLSPSEEVSRNLIFAFPEGKYPTRLKCGELSVRLPIHAG